MKKLILLIVAIIVPFINIQAQVGYKYEEILEKIEKEGKEDRIIKKDSSIVILGAKKNSHEGFKTYYHIKNGLCYKSESDILYKNGKELQEEYKDLKPGDVFIGSPINGRYVYIGMEIVLDDENEKAKMILSYLFEE